MPVFLQLLAIKKRSPWTCNHQRLNSERMRLQVSQENSFVTELQAVEYILFCMALRAVRVDKYRWVSNSALLKHAASVHLSERMQSVLGLASKTKTSSTVLQAESWVKLDYWLLWKLNIAGNVLFHSQQSTGKTTISTVSATLLIKSVSVTVDVTTHRWYRVYFSPPIKEHGRSILYSCTGSAGFVVG